MYIGVILFFPSSLSKHDFSDMVSTLEDTTAIYKRAFACLTGEPGRSGPTLINIRISDDPVTIKSHHDFIQTILITGPILNFYPRHASTCKLVSSSTWTTWTRWRYYVRDRFTRTKIYRRQTTSRTNFKSRFVQ